MTVIIDASVAAKWLFEESDTGKARALLDSVRDGRLKCMAPEIIFAEVANVLWKKVHRAELTQNEAIAHLARFERISPFPVAIPFLVESVLKTALEYRHSVYDCLYVALALKAACGLITADERLFRKFSPRIQNVRLLRDWIPQA